MVVCLLRIEHAEKDGKWKLGLNYDILKREDADETEERMAKAIESLLIGVSCHVAEASAVDFTLTKVEKKNDAAAPKDESDEL